MPTVSEVAQFLAVRDIPLLTFERPTPTAESAAQAVGCSVAEIAKSMLFLVGGEPLLVVTGGDMKVKSSLLKKAAGLTGKVTFPEPEQVIRHTGYAPGGVCPFLLPADLPVLIDASLRRFALVYPAGGDDHSAVPVGFAQLLELTGGREVNVCAPPAG